MYRITTKENEKYILMYYLKRYIQELIEFFLVVSVFKLIIKRKFLDFNLFWVPMVGGAITLILEETQSEYNEKLKNGLIGALGASIINIF